MPKLSTSVLNIKTRERLQFRDLTDEVRRALAHSEVDHGQALVFCRHTTAGVIINEHEPLLINDLTRTLDRVASPDEPYDHDDLTRRTVNLVEGEPANGHSHCQQLVVGCSVLVPVLDGQLGLGRWQRIFLVELDHGRERQVLLQFWGQ